jgi:hypothetical protein
VLVGGKPRTIFDMSGLAAALGFLLRVGVLCCAVAREGPEPPFSAAPGLAAALGSAFFGVRASWVVIIGGDHHTPPVQLHLVWPLRSDWPSLLCVRDG